MIVVPGAGLEPARGVAPRDFKSLASTNFATRAHILLIMILKNQYSECLAEGTIGNDMHP